LKSIADNALSRRNRFIALSNLPIGCALTSRRSVSHLATQRVQQRPPRPSLERRRSGDLLKALNEAYGTAETAEEYKARQKAKKRYGRTLRKERS
jgi:hypothetical protein